MPIHLFYFIQTKCNKTRRIDGKNGRDYCQIVFLTTKYTEFLHKVRKATFL